MGLIISLTIPLWHQRNKVVHLLFLKSLNFLLSRGRRSIFRVLLFLLDLWSSLEQVRGQFYHSDTSERISQEDNWIFIIECQVSKSGIFYGFLFSKSFVLLDVKIININLLEGCTGKYRWWIGGPHSIYNNHAHIENHDLSLRVSGVPDSDCPICWGWDEGGRMIVIPFYFINSK